MPEASGESEIERLKRELAEARLERDARAAELQELYAETANLRQWRSEFARVLHAERDKTLWNLVSKLRGAKKKILGGSGPSNPLDDFEPPPLSNYEIPKAQEPASPLPGALFQNAAKIEILTWGEGPLSRASEPQKRTLSENNANGDVAYVLNSLVSFGPNPLPILRETLRRAKPGECVWVIEPDALIFPSALPLTSLQHLLLDESESDRRDADEDHRREWALATGSRKTGELIPLHPHSETVFRQILDDVCANTARVESVWIDSNENSRFYIALIRKSDAQKPIVEPPLNAAAKPGGASQAMMFVLHENPFRAGAGGTEQALLMRVEALALPDAYIVYPNAPREIQCARVQNGNIAEPRTFTFRLEIARSAYMLAHAECEDLLVWIARQFGVTRVCVDHLMHWPLRLPQRLKQASLDVSLFLHDYFALNPSQNLFCELHNRRCFTSELANPEKLDACLHHFLATRQYFVDDFDAAEFLAEHQSVMKANLASASAIFRPDDSVRDRIAQTLSVDPVRFTVLPHGYAHDPITIREMKGPRIRVALIGALDSTIKGSRWIADLLQETAALPVDWHVFGRINASFEAQPMGSTLTQHGSYARADLIPLLKQHAIDVAMLTSVVDESFMLTLSEAVLAGVPAIAGDLGAQGSRIKKDGLGWVVPVESKLPVVELLSRLAKNPEERNAVARNLLKYKHLTPAENAQRFAGAFAPTVAMPQPSSRWLLAAREYEESLRAAFEASRDERLTLGEGIGVVDHYQSEWKREGDSVEWNALGNDACAMVRPQRYSRDKRHILFLDITSPFRDVLQIYFQTFAKQDWSEAQSIRRSLEKGRTKFWIELTDKLLYGPLRIDISTKPGTFQLHDLRLRVV